MALVKEDVVAVLRTCEDPEIPLNLVDLGLIYEIDIAAGQEGGSEVVVKMTLTSPNCPLSQNISHNVQRKLLELPEVRRARIDLVWEPAWNPSMISPAGRQQLQLT